MTKETIEAKRESGAVADALPTLERLREVLHYDPDTGIFTWRVRLSPRGNPGTRAGMVKTDGHRKIGIDGVQHFEHRLAWLYHYGVPPTGDLDHKNTVKFDNRIGNLRPATAVQNAFNRNPRTRFKGVKFQRGRYHASIRTGGKTGKRLYLGGFATAEEAHAAYCSKAVELHGEFMRVKMTTFETRQQLRALAAGKPEAVRNQARTLCGLFWVLDGCNTPAVRKVVASSMERLHDLNAVNGA